jgi:hypothetical protein
MSRVCWRTRNVAFARWGALVVGLLAGEQALADCDQARKGLEGRDPFVRISVLLTSRCLGDEADTEPLARTIRDEVLAVGEASGAGEKEAERAAQDERVERVLRALDLLDEALKAQFQSAPDKAQGAITALDTAIRASRQTVRASGACVPKEALAPELAPSRFRVDADDLTVSGPPKMDLKEVLGSACGAGATTECSSAIAVAENLARVSSLAESALTFYNACYIDAADAAAIVLDRKWTAYFEEARSQYPWELAFNGWRMGRHDDRPVSNGNRLGFREVPQDQWILVHPSVALEYVSAAPDGQQLKPAVLMEVVGYNRWKYRPDGSMGGALGVSAIALFADRGEVRDLGYGLMVNIDQVYSIGVTRHDSDTGYVISGDVSDLWLKVSQKKRAKLSGR